MIATGTTTHLLHATKTIYSHAKRTVQSINTKSIFLADGTSFVNIFFKEWNIRSMMQQGTEFTLIALWIYCGGKRASARMPSCDSVENEFFLQQ